MTMLEIFNLIYTSSDYAFLEENSHLGDNVMLLTLGGSYAYGTNIETSDVDVRGCALNTRRDILTGKDFEVITDKTTDTTIYSFNKLVPLLKNCNPNTIEMLGCKPEQYIKLSEAGRWLLNNVELFLSQKAAASFGGYANSQLRRLENYSNLSVTQPQMEQYILGSMQHVCDGFAEKYGIPEDSLNLFIDKALNETMETEIFMDITLHHYPIRDYCDFWAELKNIITSYKAIGARNSKALEHNKITKHMMHLVRLYIMGIDILEDKGVITYREKEHDLLMDIRNGKYSQENQLPNSSFYDMLDEYVKRFDYAKANTALPKYPDYDKIDDLVAEINSHAFE